ncbi:thioredoxin family protein [Salicibibacter cibarius]|uniref:Thioredoxin family protein n=1 Tax=Salicibibacter cibarius TaxID=2743000 RepID=A0A7T6Z303_9BACI|nr:thioredoxin family protein [Salicibibacter cibarius]QQK76063.1 thioredoxin family protein [Salicibibacter cibarius]
MLQEISASEWKKIEPLHYTGLLITSPFCATCTLAEKMVEEALNLERQTDIYKLNLQLAPDFAREYKIQSVPMLLLFYGKEPVGRLSPIKNPANIIHFLATYRSN